MAQNSNDRLILIPWKTSGGDLYPGTWVAIDRAGYARVVDRGDPSAVGWVTGNRSYADQLLPELYRMIEIDTLTHKEATEHYAKKESHYDTREKREPKSAWPLLRCYGLASGLQSIPPGSEVVVVRGRSRDGEPVVRPYCSIDRRVDVLGRTSGKPYLLDDDGKKYTPDPLCEEIPYVDVEEYAATKIVTELERRQEVLLARIGEAEESIRQIEALLKIELGRSR